MQNKKNLLDLVQRVTSQPGYTQRIGTRVVSVEAGDVTMELFRQPELVQANGYFHGGVIAGLADHAAGAAVTTSIPEGEFALTVSLHINYIKPADGQKLIARAVSLGKGNTVGFAQVDIFSVDCKEFKTQCATASATLRHVKLDGSKISTTR